jgi:hypothetical protein
LGLRSFGWLLSLGFRFPPRVSDQPIFYPVLTREYARQIARDWNTMDAASGFVGFVTQFEVDDTFAQKYPVQTAGGRTHQELWVPAENWKSSTGISLASSTLSKHTLALPFRGRLTAQRIFRSIALIDDPASPRTTLVGEEFYTALTGE